MTAIQQEMANNLEKYIDRVEMRGDSFIARLNKKDFDVGITKMKTYSSKVDVSMPVCHKIDFFVFQK